MSDTLVAHPEASKEALDSQNGPELETLAPYQQSLAATLGCSTIASITLASILTAHFTTRLYAELLIAGSISLLLIQHDYQNFLNLGRGGVPFSFRGYLKIAWLRLFILRDPFSPPSPDPTATPRSGILAARNLPHRKGPRPEVAGIIPHRQLDQRGAEGPYLSLRASVHALALAHPEMLTTGRSCFEKHGLGLFSRRPVNETCHGEILHVHDSDRAMHMSLHPEDIRGVLERGWVERHPLAGQGAHLKDTFVLVYAPRSMSFPVHVPPHPGIVSPQLTVYC